MRQHTLSHDISDLRSGSLARLGGRPPQATTLSPARLAAYCQRLRLELETLATFIPHPLVHAQLMSKAPVVSGGAWWSGSVLCAEVLGVPEFTAALVERGHDGATALGAVLGRLFAGFAEECHRYCGGLLGGGLLEFDGQNLLAFFDTDVLGSDHSAYAASAALAMQRRVDALATPETGGYSPLRLRVGVHSGKVFAAVVGRRPVLLLAGADTLRAAQAREAAAPGEVIVSDTTLDWLRHTGVGLYTQERGGGLNLLVGLPAYPPPPRMDRWGWEAGPGDLGELRRLEARIASLRPYLPMLPPTALQPDAEPQRVFVPTAALCVQVAPFDELIEHFADPLCATAALDVCHRTAEDVAGRYGGELLPTLYSAGGPQFTIVFSATPAHTAPLRWAQDAAAELVSALAALGAQIDQIATHSLPAGASTAREVAPVALRPRAACAASPAFVGQVSTARRSCRLIVGSALAEARSIARA